MRIFFAGTPEYAVWPLQALAQEFEICGVLTNPDKPVGRGKKLAPPPVKSRALELAIRVFQPQKLDQDFLGHVKALEPDLLVVAAYSKIFRESFISLFPRGGINIHPSLLPKYRGPSPVQAAILNGERETGVTVQRLALKMDSGEILEQQRVPLEGRETAPDLLHTSFQIGARLAVNVVQAMEQGEISGAGQVEEEATYCHLLKKQDGLINWEDGADKIERMIRAYLPWPRAYTRFGGLDLFLLEGGVLPSSYLGQNNVKVQGSPQPGGVLGIDKDHGILIHTGEGILTVKRLQLKTKRAMDWRSFLNGVRDFIGSRLGEHNAIGA